MFNESSFSKKYVRRMSQKKPPRNSRNKMQIDRFYKEGMVSIQEKNTDKYYQYFSEYST